MIGVEDAHALVPTRDLVDVCNTGILETVVYDDNPPSLSSCAVSPIAGIAPARRTPGSQRC
jgi:hypothetical protein